MSDKEKTIQLKQKHANKINRRSVQSMKDNYNYAQDLCEDGGICALHNTLSNAIKAFFMFGMDAVDGKKPVSYVINESMDYIVNTLVNQIMAESPFKQMIEDEVVVQLQKDIANPDCHDPDVEVMRAALKRAGVSFDAAVVLKGTMREIGDQLAGLEEAARHTKQ